MYARRLMGAPAGRRCPGKLERKERDRTMRVSRWIARAYRLVAVLAVLAMLVTLAARVSGLALGPDLALSIPLGSGRSLILMAAFRRLVDEAPGSVDGTFYEVRLWAGQDDRSNDSYRQLVDLTAPLWPPWP